MGPNLIGCSRRYVQLNPQLITKFEKLSGICKPMTADNNLHDLIHKLNSFGVLLSQESNLDRLLEILVETAMDLTQAQGGTVYLTEKDQTGLRLVFARNELIDLEKSGLLDIAKSSGVLLFKSADGLENHSNVSAHAALTRSTINIEDVYLTDRFNFSGTRTIDQKIGYRSQSMLVVPMVDHQGQLLGVLQLINAYSPSDGKILPFTSHHQSLAQSLASQASIAISNQRLIQELELIFESFIRMINQAIDEKSPYTGGHCARVPEIALRLAEACHQVKEGPLASFRMSDADRYEFKIAALLHDCGKVTTPVHVVDKSTKLETIFDRIHLLDTRFEVIRRDFQIEFLKQQLCAAQQGQPIDAHEEEARFLQKMEQIQSDQVFLRQCNKGSERMSDADRARIEQISKQYLWVPNGEQASVAFLSENELENLNIVAGTLTSAERQIINHHIESTINMLEAIPWPNHLRNVTEYAGGHHERMDGKGYPKGLTGQQMSVQARILAIADIFEALTAADRPYKNPMKLSQSLSILKKMSQEGHIDPDLFDVFISSKVYLDYGNAFLNDAQLDVR
ncbi:MAG: GAF domain-containing protein [Betaproteobacteria bacterium]|nr:GAF domain-containing protein [Betaproteobacteria bacterium]